MKVTRKQMAMAAGGTALVLAMTGVGATAGVMVGSGQIKDGSIKSKDIADGGIKFKDLKGGTKKKLKGAPGPAGKTGPRGPVGPAGPAGSASVISAFGQQGFDRINNNPAVQLTPDGVKIGPFADGGADGASLCYAGLNGEPLSSVESLTYTMRYTAGTGNNQETGGVGSPYLRIFTDNGANPDNSAIFSPNTQAPDGDFAEGPFHDWVTSSGTFRYNDDIGNGPETPFATLVADHGTEEITRICVSLGFSAGANLTGLLRSMEINGTTYEFRG